MNIIDNNTKAFLTLIKAGLWEKDVRLSQFAPIDYCEVYRLADEQSVVGLVAAGINHIQDVKVPQEMVLQFVGTALQLEQRNQEMNSFISKLIDKLRKVDIYTLIVKGQGVAQCYERPLWRCCGDVDLFLSEDNYNRAKELLVPIASDIEKEYVREKHLGMTINGFVVELHGTLHSGLSAKIENGLDEIKKAFSVEERFGRGKMA